MSDTLFNILFGALAVGAIVFILNKKKAKSAQDEQSYQESKTKTGTEDPDE